MFSCWINFNRFLVALDGSAAPLIQMSLSQKILIVQEFGVLPCLPKAVEAEVKVCLDHLFALRRQLQRRLELNRIRPHQILQLLEQLLSIGVTQDIASHYVDQVWFWIDFTHEATESPPELAHVLLLFHLSKGCHFILQ